MFFVGATGQILTLLLTVCLPFVFIISGYSNAEVQEPTLQFEIIQNQSEVSVSTIQTCFYADVSIVVLPDLRSEFGIVEDKTILPDKPGVKWETIYSKSSGNKAPPVFHCSC